MPAVDRPTVTILKPLVLEALAGGEVMTVAELRAHVARSGSLSEAALTAPHGASKSTEFAYQLRWALTDLRRGDIVERTGGHGWRLLGTIG